MSETTFQHGSSYGPESAAVQFAVGSQDGALGTFFRGARRINRIRLKHVEGVAADVEVQQNDNLGSTGWTIVGSGVTLQPLGEATIDVSGLVTKPYARLFGGANVAGAGTAIVRATIDDLDLIDHFRQNVPYGVG